MKPEDKKLVAKALLVAASKLEASAPTGLDTKVKAASFDGGQEHMYFHVTPKSNLARILKTGLLPKIGARSKKLKEPNPAIYLFGSKEDAEEAVMNWLGDEFGDSALVLLSVSLPTDSVTKDGFEYRVYDAVDPSKIEVIGDL